MLFSRLCEKINVNNENDVASLFENLASNFAGIVQYNKDNRPKSPTHNITIDVVCDVMMDREKGVPVHRLAMVNDMLLAASNQTCLDYTYKKMIQDMSNTTWDSSVAEGGNVYYKKKKKNLFFEHVFVYKTANLLLIVNVAGRQWTYQTCVEFGFFQTSSMTEEIFSNKFPVDFFTKQCTDIFGSK